MRVFVLISLLFFRLFADSALDSIEVSYKEASTNFKIQKSEHNITKLLGITKVLYENNKKLKELKAKYTKKLIVELTSEKDLDKLQVDDIVELHVKTSHDINEEYTKSNLSFFIYDGDELLVKKDVELYEKSGVHKESLKFEITEPSDKYKICATFKENGKEYKECKSFGVVELLKVKDLIVSASRDATTMDDNMYVGEDIYIISGFTLKNIKDRVNIDVRLVDTTKNKLLIATTFKRPKDNSIEKQQPLRFKIPSSKLYKGQKLTFNMKIYSEKINPIVKNIDIYIKSYKLLVSAPSSLKSGQHGKYKITIPKKFIAPLEVDIEPTGAIVIAQITKLSGNISAINKNNEKGYLKIRVTDANGRVATFSKSIRLIKKEIIQNADCNYPDESYSMLYGNSKTSMATSIYPRKEDVYSSSLYKASKIEACGCIFYIKNNDVKQSEVGIINSITIYKYTIGFSKHIKQCSDFKILEKGTY